MKDTLIYKTLEKNSMPVLDVDYHISNLFKYAEYRYFYPSNKESDDYAICSLLSEMHLIQSKRIPIWINGSFRGVRVCFLYSKDLEYTLINLDY